MKSEWVTVPLGDVLTLQRGHDLPAQNRLSGDIPILGSSGITGYHNEAKATGPGVTVGRSGNSMGEISHSDKDFWPLNTALYVTDFKGNDPKFIYYLLKTIDFDQFNSGSAQKSLNRNAVYPFEVEIPKSRTEQQRISSVLSSLEEKVGMNHKINQTLEQMAQAIFKSWFVDFEPVKAKIAALEAGGSEEDALLAAMQAISGKGEAELTRLQTEQPEQYAELRATAELFPAAMQDSELGEIPEGWSVSQIGDLVTRIPVGKKYSQKTASETGEVPVLDQGKSGIIGFHNEKPGVTACPDDPVIVFANHTCYMRLIMHDFSAIQNVLPFKSKPARARSIFWLYFATLGKQEFIEYKGHWPDFVIKEIVVPDDSIASRFGSIAKDLVINQFRNDKQNETLSTIRDAMLPKLLSGELSVADVANQTEGAEASVNA